MWLRLLSRSPKNRKYNKGKKHSFPVDVDTCLMCSDILLQFVSESVVLSTIGGMVGIFLGWLSLYFIGQIEIGDDPFRTEFTLDIAMLAFGVSAATGLFFGIFPALRASKLQPVEALRYQ